MDFNDQVLRGWGANIRAASPLTENLPYLTVGGLKGMLCLQGATVLCGCFLLYSSFYKFATHKAFCSKDGGLCSRKMSRAGSDSRLPRLALWPGCVDCYAKLSLSTARKKVTQAVWRSCLVVLSR